MALRLKTLLAGLLILGGGCFTSAAEFRGLWVDAFGAGFFNAGQVKQLAGNETGQKRVSS